MKNALRSHFLVSAFIPMFAITAGILLLSHASPAAAQDDERDFVPGEKAIFIDDYSDMTKGAAMPHWKVRGGNVKLCPDGTCVLLKGSGSLTPNIVAMPKNFTIETEVRHLAAVPYAGFKWSFSSAAGEKIWFVNWDFDVDPGKCEVTVLNGDEYLAKTRVDVPWDKPINLSIWFQDQRLRVYVNDQKAADANQLELKPWKTAVLDFSFEHAEQDLPMLGRVRVAESVPDISQVLLSTGKYISHGIQFDVNSDQLKPESLNILSHVANALKKKPALKLRIEGHTDSTGDADKNLDLSRRRAAAVKEALVKLGIDAARLTTDGFGQTKPIASNDTVQGRAENRRVEFIGM